VQPAGQHQPQNLIGYGLSRPPARPPARPGQHGRCALRGQAGTRSQPSTRVLRARRATVTAPGCSSSSGGPKMPAMSALICHRCQQTAARRVARADGAELAAALAEQSATTALV